MWKLAFTCLQPNATNCIARLQQIGTACRYWHCYKVVAQQIVVLLQSDFRNEEQLPSCSLGSKRLAKPYAVKILGVNGCDSISPERLTKFENKFVHKKVLLSANNRRPFASWINSWTVLMHATRILALFTGRFSGPRERERRAFLFLATILPTISAVRQGSKRIDSIQ